MAWGRLVLAVGTLLGACQLWQRVVANMATETDPPHDGKYYIEVCFDISQYQPSCGWRLLLSCSYPLTSVLSYTYNVMRRDDYSYIIYNYAYNAAISQPDKCQRMTIEGTWGFTTPTVVVSWFCVCNSTTSPECQSTPYAEVPPFDATPAVQITTQEVQAITSAEEQVTQSHVQTQASEVTTLSSPVYYQGYHHASPNRMHMAKHPGGCYTGTSFSTVTNTRSPIECALACIGIQECRGVNYIDSTGLCHLVSVTVDVTLHLYNPVPPISCQYWDVVAKFIQ